MRYLVRHILAVIIIAGLSSGMTVQALAASETEELIVKSRLTAEKLLAHRDFPDPRDWVKKSKEVTLGGDASIAIGTEGAGVKGATTLEFGKDIFSFSKEVGLYGGASVEGAWVGNREAFNTEYYGAKATPKEILMERKVSHPGADMLRAVLDSK